MLDHEHRWLLHYEALLNYKQRTGSAIVPTGHIEGVIPLGNWVNYMRTRHSQGKLSEERIKLLNDIEGWSWGPLRPGPKKNKGLAERDKHIRIMRNQGYSLSSIGQTYQLSRQRVHQILKEESHG